MEYIYLRCYSSYELYLDERKQFKDCVFIVTEEQLHEAKVSCPVG